MSYSIQKEIKKLNKRLERNIDNVYTETYYTYFKYFKRIVTSMFKWENTGNIPPDYFEKKLFECGILGCFVDESLGFMCSTVTGRNLNNYDEFEEYEVKINNFQNKVIDKENIVIIKNNVFCDSSYRIIDYYCKRIAYLEQCAQTNLSLQKFPIIGECDEEQYLSIINFFNKVQEGTPLIVKKSGMDVSKFECFNMKIPFIAEQLINMKEYYEKQCLKEFGINYNPNPKKERMINAEVNSNREQLQIINFSLLNFREEACHMINEKFNYNIQVRYNSEIVSYDENREVE